ncbi:hypothetical protein BDR22DRAFT_885545 [Usnea florida]
MHHNTLIIALGLTFAARTSAAPLSELAPDVRPLFTSVSSAPASTATGMATGKVPDHKHPPNCDHSHNAPHTTTSRDAQNTTSGTRATTTMGYGHAAKTSGYPSPCPDANASADSHPHAVKPLNRTGHYYCNHPSHLNTTTTTDATHDKMIHPRMLNESAESLHNNHTDCHCLHHPSHLLDNGTHSHHPHEYNGTHHNITDYPCTHASHHNGTAVAEHSHEKPSLIPRVDVTVCLTADCKTTEVVTADVSTAGQVQGVYAKNGRRAAKRRDMEREYRDVARQMDGVMIAGGI